MNILAKLLGTAMGFAMFLVLPVATVVGAGCSSIYGCIGDTDQPLNPADALNSLKHDVSGLRGIETQGTAIDAIIKWTNFALGFVAVIAIAYIVYAGFLHITAGEDEEKAKQARRMIMQAVVGIIIIISAYAIVNTFIG